MTDLPQRVAAVGLLAVVIVSAAGPTVVLAAAPYFADDPVSQDRATLATSSGVEISLPDGERRLRADGEMFPNAQTANIVSSQGNVTVSGNGPGHIGLVKINGTTTQLDDVDSSTLVKVNPEDKQTLSVRGNFSQISWTGPFELDDDERDFAYQSATGGTVKLSLESDTSVAAVDDSTGEVLAGNQTDNGTLVLTGLDAGSHDVRLIKTTGELRLSDPYPVGELSSSPNTLAVNVSDGDFPQDNVSLEWRVNGTLINTTQVSEDGRESVTIPSLERGTHTASVHATDSYGRVDVLNWTFGTPEKLEIRDVTQPDSLITGQQVTAVFVAGDTTVKRTTTTGQIDLTGLPPEDSLTVKVRTSGYVTRSYVVRNLADEQSVYLLPDTASSYEIEFVLEDRSGGEFEPSQSKILIQRPIEINGTFEYVTVGGGDFGAANSHITSLQQGEDYRIQILSAGGEIRDIGTYSADSSTTEVIIVGKFAVDPETDSGSSTRLETFSEDTDNDGEEENYVRVGYRDPDRKTDQIDYRIVSTDGEVVADQTASIDGSDKYVATFEVNKTDGVTYELEGNVTRSGQKTAIRGSAGGVVPPLGDIPLDPRWGELFGLVIIVASAGLVVIVDSALGALAAVAAAVFVTMLGLTSIPSAAIGLAGAVAVFGIFGRDTQ